MRSISILNGILNSVEDSPLPDSADTTCEPAAPLKATGWIVAPWIDLLFLANLAWPALLLLEGWGGLDAHDGLQFWQVYFVTTPHRWITLALVFVDRRQFVQRPLTYVGLACVVTVLCLTVRATTGTLTCLLAIDYAWNAWHFAAQHHGIYLSRQRSPRGLSEHGSTLC